MSHPSNLPTLAFVDVETTGLDPDWHEIIDVAVLLVDAAEPGCPVRRSFATRVLPEHPERLTAEAQRINGYSPQAWGAAISVRIALEFVQDLTRGCVLAGHNVAFDIRFLEIALRRASVPPLEVDHRIVDTASLAWPLVMLGELRARSLDGLCQHYGIHDSDYAPHTALGDVYRTFEVYKRLMDRISPRTPPVYPLGVGDDGADPDD